MRYISSSSSSFLLSFPPQQNQLSEGAEAGSRGSLGGFHLGPDGRKDQGLSAGGGRQLERTTGRTQEEVRMGKSSGRREGEEEVGYPVDMHKQEASAKAAAAKTGTGLLGSDCKSA